MPVLFSETVLHNTSNLLLFGIEGWQGVSRKKREAELEALTSDDFSFLPTKRKYKTLVRKLWFVMVSHRLMVCECEPQVCAFSQTCTDGLRCVEIHCPLQGLDSTAMVVLHSRLWNTTFMEVRPDLWFIFQHWKFVTSKLSISGLQLI